ncbi:MAG TPA: ATP-dependent DNA helicase [Acidimicrobiales bacterium]|nr:ATP-dependent DNA helicase [Acidimicrobiales bacterium]
MEPDWSDESAAPGQVNESARRAGNDAVAALAKVTAEMSSGEQRPEQQEMCRAVAEALVTGTHLVVQAGTGTGKSLAYLVPAILSRKKVVVATATKALQDQLAEKDLPLVEAGLGLPFSYAVLKGRSNYICRQRVAEVGNGGIQPELGAAPDDTAESETSERDDDRAGAAPEGLVEEVRTLVAWSEKTMTGDRGDLNFEPSSRAWGMVSVGPRECPGAFNCPSGSRCFAEAARENAAAADVVVVNTHLYGAHLASGRAVLPEHEVVVFDETHELEEVMTSSLGVEVTPGRFRALATSARSLINDKDEDLLTNLQTLGDQLGAMVIDRVGTRLMHDDAQPPVDDRAIADLINRAADAAKRVLDALRRSGMEQSLFAEGGGSSSNSADRNSRKTRAVSAATHLTEDLQRLVARKDGEVAWVDGTRRNPRVRLSPIDVGPPLAAALWGDITAVLTSATVPPSLIERVGLDSSETNQLDVGSPFDYRAHALLYVARHLPDRRHPDSEAALHEELALLIGAAGGRTLALFTSRRATDEAAAALRPDLPYTLLLQGDLPKGRLLEQFAADETSCLFATMSFWQGVDIPGRALSLVTLDRLPFPRPDDPLLQARRARAGGRAFSIVDLPRAATLLAQGSGRLIRTAEDRGVVAVLDPRLATASYRGVLLSTLPPMRRSVEFSEVEAFLRNALGESDVEPG